MSVEWNNRILIAGVSGTGKSWLGIYILSQYILQNKRKYFVFLSDNRAEYDRYNHNPQMRPKNLGFKLVQFGSEQASKKWNFAEILRKNNRLYIETGDLSSEEVQNLVNDLSKAFWQLGNGFFVIDEAWTFLNRRYPPKNYERLARGGRKNSVDVMAITQRVVDIYPDILSQYNLIISFRLAELNDKMRISRYFEDFNGVRPDEIIGTLKQGEYIIKDTEQGLQERESTFNI